MPPAIVFLPTCQWTLLTSIQKANKEKRGVIFKRAESYVKEYRDAERERVRLARAARQEGNYYVEDEPKLVFVVRIKGYDIHMVCPPLFSLTS